MGRGINWTSSDDIEMCRSWLHVSGDSKVGNSQKFANFWAKIMADLKTKVKTGESARTLRAAQSRWTIINNSCAKFASAHIKASRSAPSGTNLVDLERRAMEMYRIEHGNGKSFEFKECWAILRASPKWQAPLEIPVPQGNSSTMEHNTLPDLPPGTPSGATSETPVQSRPVGSKRAKANFQQAKVSDTAIKELKEANRLANKRARILQDQVALSYIKIQDQDVPLEFREIFMKRRAKVMQDLNEEEGPPSPAASAQSPPQNTEDIMEEPVANHVAEHDDKAGDDDEVLCYGEQLPYDHMSYRSINSLLEEEIMDPQDMTFQRTMSPKERDLTLGF